MQIDPNDLMIYAAVVEAGSFTQAAKRLDLPKSSVSRRVAALEEGVMRGDTTPALAAAELLAALGLSSARQ